MRGDFRFRGRFTNTSNSTSTGFRSFADFLYGIPDSTQRQLGAYPAELTAWQSAFYLQDNWRLNSWLTLNLGVRYDYTPFLYEKSDRISTFIPELGVTACAGGAFSDDEGNQICVDGASLGLGRALIKTDKNNFAPRVGFAVLPFGDNKTVVRGGAGIYYSTETINPARQMLANNYPYLNRQSYNRASTSDILQLTFTDPFPENRVNLQGVNTPQGIPLDAETPEVYHFNLTFERELTDDLGIEIGYVGSEGRKLGMRYNLNYQYPTGEIAGTGLPVVARAFPTYGDISYQIQGVNSSYHALQASIRRRSKNGLPSWRLTHLARRWTTTRTQIIRRPVRSEILRTSMILAVIGPWQIIIARTSFRVHSMGPPIWPRQGIFQWCQRSCRRPFVRMAAERHRDDAFR